MAKIAKKELLAAYKELDEVVGIEPAIEFENEEQFGKEMFEVITDPEVVTPKDKFSKTTKATFDKLKEMYSEEEIEEDEVEEEEEEEEEEEAPVKKGAKKPAPAPVKKGKKSEPEEEEEEEEEVEEEEEEEPVKKNTKKSTPAPAPVKKGKKPEPEEEEEEEEAEDLISDKIEEAEDEDDLKAILKENKDLFKGFKSKDYTSFKKLKKAMLEFVEPAPVPVKKEKSKKSVGGPGVINSIAKYIQEAGKKGISKGEILEKLQAAFPDRAEASMKNTINVQVPNRMSKEKFQIIKLENGNYAAKK